MSVYNGFGTRQQEVAYSKALYNTVFLLQLRIYKLFKGDKFDDIKFGKVLTKLYARLYSLEDHKYQPPKFSFALKDLAVFLGIFEVSEEELKKQRGDQSETSSNLSYMTQSAFNPHKGRSLDIIKEDQEQKDDEEEDDDDDNRNKTTGIHTTGEKAKSGVKSLVKGTAGETTFQKRPVEKAQTSHASRRGAPGETVSGTVSILATAKDSNLIGSQRKNRAGGAKAQFDPVSTLQQSKVYVGGKRLDPISLTGGVRGKDQLERGGRGQRTGQSQPMVRNNIRHSQTRGGGGGTGPSSDKITTGGVKLERNRSIGDQKQQQKRRKPIQNNDTLIDEASQRNKSSSNASYQSNFSNTSKGPVQRRQATNSSRGSNWSQASSLKRRQNFSSVAMHKANFKRPKIPGPPKVAELTFANLQAQQRAETAESQATNYAKKGNKSRISKQSAGNSQIALSGQVKPTSGPKSDFHGAAGHAYNHNKSLLDGSQSPQDLLNGSIDDTQDRGDNAYAVDGHHRSNQLSPSAVTHSTAGAPLQQRNGGVNSQIRLSISSIKQQANGVSRTSEKVNPEKRLKQQFQIAHMQSVDRPSGGINSSNVNRRRVVSSSQSLKQRGPGQKYLNNPSTQGYGEQSKNRLEEMESSYFASNGDGLQGPFSQNQTLDSIDGSSLPPPVVKASSFSIDDESFNISNMKNNQNNTDESIANIANQSLEIVASSSSAQKQQRVANTTNHSKNGTLISFGAHQIVNSTQRDNNNQIGSNRQRQRGGVGSQPTELQILNKQPPKRDQPRELKPIADKKIAKANMQTIYSQKVHQPGSNSAAQNQYQILNTTSATLDAQRKKFIPKSSQGVDAYSNIGNQGHQLPPPGHVRGGRRTTNQTTDLAADSQFQNMAQTQHAFNQRGSAGGSQYSEDGQYFDLGGPPQNDRYGRDDHNLSHQLPTPATMLGTTYGGVFNESHLSEATVVKSNNARLTHEKHQLAQTAAKKFIQQPQYNR